MSEADHPAAPVPIVLITGYLGSGKTTLLNHLLATAQGRRFAVLVNDFGAINVDERLIEGVVDGVVPLENGCICCSLEGGLHSAIVRALRSGTRPEAILIEASGVSNAGELARILTDDAMRGFAALELIVNTFDCDHWQGCSPQERELIETQLPHADVVVLTKLDLVSAGEREAVGAVVQRVAPGALVIAEAAANVTADLLLGGQFRGSERKPLKPAPSPPAHDLFRSWQVAETAPFTQAGFQALLNGLPADTVRGKGHVCLAEFPETRFLFQMVGKRASVVPSGDWGQAPARTELVFIALRSKPQTGADYALAATPGDTVSSSG